MLERVLDSVDAQSLTLGRLIAAFVVLTVFYLLGRLVRRRTTHWLEEKDVSEGTPEPIGRISGWAINLLGIVIAMLLLGFQAGPLVLVLGIFAAIAGISGKGVIENFSAGLTLQITQPFVVGDRIETEGITGWVEAINSHAVVLKTVDGRRVQVPNRDVLGAAFYNYTETQRRRSEVAFSVAYGQDLSRVREVAVDAAASVDVVDDGTQPVADIDKLTDGVGFQLRFFHTDEDRIEARDRVAEALVNALAEAKIQLTTPELLIQQVDRNVNSADEAAD